MNETINNKAPRCRIIGVLDNGPASLTSHALEHIRNADVIIGGDRVLGLFADYINKQAKQHDLKGQLMQVAEWIRTAQAQQLRVVVLATGDPLCHGIAGFLQSRLCIEACEILPNISILQVACARLGMPWQSIKICSVHSSDTGEWNEQADHRHGLYPLLHALQQHSSIAVFTSPDNTPDRIARMLVQEGMAADFQMAVTECLHMDDENIITDCSIDEAAERPFANPNILLLWRSGSVKHDVIFGLADERFRQRKPDKGLITKREVRAVSLARMQLRSNSIVWDIGAGSGAVGLEAARIARDGYVYAVEKNTDDVAIARENQRALGVHNYRLIHAKAPQGMEDWSNPDAIFIGGSGGELGELIALCLQRMNDGGVLVMNFVTFENLNTALEALKASDADWDVTQLQASRSKPILHMNRLAAENPVWVVCAVKKSTES